MNHKVVSVVRVACRGREAVTFSLAIAMLCGAPAAKADLVGAQVTITGNFPTLADQFTNTLRGTVPVGSALGDLAHHNPEQL